MELNTFVPPIFWAGFIAFVLAMLALDLFVLGGKSAHKVSVKEALGWTAVWVTLSLSFCGLLWWWLDGGAGREVALHFDTGVVAAVFSRNDARVVVGHAVAAIDDAAQPMLTHPPEHPLPGVWRGRSIRSAGAKGDQFGRAEVEEAGFHEGPPV